LLGVELRRFAWRRSFRVFGLIALAGIALASTITYFTSHPGPIPVDSFDPGFRLVTLTEIFGGTSIPLIILGLAFGASFIGAEWHAGTVTPLLTWQPRRVLVFVTKALAGFLAVVASAIALQAILGLALWLVAALRGTTEGADVAWLAETAGVAGRGAIIAGLMSVLGFAIGSTARNTTVALIIGFVYFAIGESILRGLKPAWQPWLIGDNAAAFVVGDTAETFGLFRTPAGALLIVLLYATAALALSTAWFQARDVN
jgi:ABC-type transport system involved in multi-copper enzyme maturation permease subunit